MESSRLIEPKILYGISPIDRDRLGVGLFMRFIKTVD